MLSVKTIVLQACIAFICVCGFVNTSNAQGRVVINEFLAWSGCNTTSEFIELMNFGPGPMDISCYIVTNGKYAVTIPPNTILQAGQYYLLAGQNVLDKTCSKLPNSVTVDLNWNNCNNCADKPIPTTGDGFMENGGNANEKLVLLDPSLNVIDAVSRQLPVSSSVSITTSGVGGCTPRTFNLGNMNIEYETINNSTGVDNSYARRVDGDCGWVKTTAISPRSANNTGSTSSATYSFSTLSASECETERGKISIGVSGSNVSSLFPMSYILAYDKDSNGIFTQDDIYIHGVDSSAPSIDIGNLLYGRYRITVSSSMGCNLKTYDFFIFNCYGLVLPLKLLSFDYVGKENNQLVFESRFNSGKELKALHLEGNDGGGYKTLASVAVSGDKDVYRIKVPASNAKFYRLKMIDQFGLETYSSVISVKAAIQDKYSFWPNPVQHQINFQTSSNEDEKLNFYIFNSLGKLIIKGAIQSKAGTAIHSINTETLPQGLYQLVIQGFSNTNSITHRFMKQ